jgi:hypothetical protein
MRSWIRSDHLGGLLGSDKHCERPALHLRGALHRRDVLYRGVDLLQQVAAEILELHFSSFELHDYLHLRTERERERERERECIFE